MALHRRGFLQLAGLVSASAVASACSRVVREVSGVPGAWADWPPGSERDFAILKRLSYGAGLEDRRRVAAFGIQAWIEEQLAPETILDSGVEWRLRPLDALRLDAAVLADWDQEDVVGQLRQATLLRRIYSRRQIYELIVEFWTDHFNLSTSKGDCWFLKSVDDREVIRPHALGTFRELLTATIRSPAMLVYLDNQVNRKGAPNENYAREILELHTLGVDGGYSQRDVMELARCLTGWSVKRHFWRGEFTFREAFHDPGVKHVLGRRVEPFGQQEVEGILDRLAVHTSTARHIARKLVRRFVQDQPEQGAQDLIERATRTFLQTQGDLLAVLRGILLDGVARAEAFPPPKYKRPVDFVVSALRCLNADSDGGPALQEFLSQMGQPLFAWPTPDGPPDVASYWMTNLLPRWRLAAALARNAIPGTRIEWDEFYRLPGATGVEGTMDALSDLMLGVPFDPALRTDLLETLHGAGATGEDLFKVVAAGLLASPAFQWR